MKIEITETPKITYNKVIYVLKIKVEDTEYKVSRHEDDNAAELYIEPHPEKDEVYDAIENLFSHDDFHYNTTQSGDTLEVEGDFL
jgi:hypothetical protein